MTITISERERDMLLIALGIAAGKHRMDPDQTVFRGLLAMAERLQMIAVCIHCRAELTPLQAVEHQCEATKSHRV